MPRRFTRRSAARSATATILVAMSVAALAASVADGAQPAVDAAEARAVAYLSAEVPRWRREHACYSCHNNGDATRALLAASAQGHAVGDAIDDTLAWLATPERWDSNAKRGGSDDLPLARIQFASALASMAAAGRATPDALDRAARLLVVHQGEDGSWRLSESQILGGPTFYGTSLATAMARRTLALSTFRIADLGSRTAGKPSRDAREGGLVAPKRETLETREGGADVARRALAKADAWLRGASPAAVLDASAILLGLERDRDPAALAQRQKALEVLKRGQGPDGGWGPYVTSQSEPFDTALAVLALAGLQNADALPIAPYSDRELTAAVERARAYIVGLQSPDGSWPETTRPPNGESYAQRISTTAWALLALLASGPP